MSGGTSNLRRTIAVTGSASGIGAATRARLELDGIRVIGVDVRGAEVEADLATPDGREAAYRGIADECGGVLDGFIGYAGVGPTVADASLLTTVNYFGQMNLLAQVRTLLRAGTAPAVVAVSSIAPMVSPVDDDAVSAMVAGDEAKAVELTLAGDDPGVAYSSSKLAVARVARSWALEWIGEGIRINVLAPGNTRTPMTDDMLADATFGPMMEAIPVPVGRWAEPDDIAPIAAFLLSPESRYVVGSVFVVDGGVDALARTDLV